MQKTSSFECPPPEKPELLMSAGWVREGLSGRCKMPTAAEERRLVKTLERLQPAANVALAAAGSGALSLTGDFRSMLVKLSHA